MPPDEEVETDEKLDRCSLLIKLIHKNEENKKLQKKLLKEVYIRCILIGVIIALFLQLIGL